MMVRRNRSNEQEKKYSKGLIERGIESPYDIRLRNMNKALN
jgi:hypothetical protein